ncbi:MAG TPA: hypothetical protein VL997_00065 [Dyella sp.]|nr:hypothetical protein [Dyella sp.]
MEDIDGVPSWPQFYVLSEEGYQGLKDIQATLAVMAAITYTEDDDKNGKSFVTIRRKEMFNVFEEISAQIGEALEGLKRENEIATRSTMRH